jgi:hypothetical protein
VANYSGVAASQFFFSRSANRFGVAPAVQATLRGAGAICATRPAPRKCVVNHGEARATSRGTGAMPRPAPREFAVNHGEARAKGWVKKTDAKCRTWDWRSLTNHAATKVHFSAVGRKRRQPQQNENQKLSSDIDVAECKPCRVMADSGMTSEFEKYDALLEQTMAE